MKILVIGSGGREHALVWKLSQSPSAPELICIPGNAGIAQLAECIEENVTNLDALLEIAKDRSIDLTVVGPELPLSLGIVDKFTSHGLAIFGPSREAARLESSKAFAKKIMFDNNIPTASYRLFNQSDSAIEYIKKIKGPFVIKADGLAAGKGVFVCDSISEGIKAVKIIMEDHFFGEAGNQIIIEEYLQGEEASFLAFTDGNSVVPMASSQDHKALYDGDKGPNTGGLGAYSPAPIISQALHEEIMDRIMIPTIEGLKKLGILYKGILYAGLMIYNGKPKVLEFNVRFGDPEAQPILMRLQNDLVEVLYACINGTLHQIDLTWRKESAVCVVAASDGYPGPYHKGYPIDGLAEKKDNSENVSIFHAGTKKEGDKIVTAGGRVFCVTALADNLTHAINTAYSSLSTIHFEGIYYRKDIGKKGLA
ncbi:MAG: phosphoribosylamine--glycine ligase [bacterium]